MTEETFNRAQYLTEQLNHLRAVLKNSLTAVDSGKRISLLVDWADGPYYEMDERFISSAAINNLVSGYLATMSRVISEIEAELAAL